jgi:hypothetical protein
MFGKSQIRVVDTSGAREKSADSVGQEPTSTGDDRERRGAVELWGFSDDFTRGVQLPLLDYKGASVSG